MSGLLLLTESSHQVRTCETCGEPMPGAHPKRKFCSGKCRKAQYSTPCIDCGAPTSGSEGRREDARCWDCGQRHSVPIILKRGAERRQASRPRAEELARMYRDGVALAELAAHFGVSKGRIGGWLDRLRKQGYDLPHRRSTWRGVPYVE